jgi:outer membrane lipoprotein carrier protein
MTRPWIAMGAVLALAMSQGHALGVDDVVRKVQQRYDDTRDFTADVTQEMTIASLGKTVTSSGTVSFKKPGRLRWEITQGDAQVVVADGTTLWLFQPREKQVLKTPFDAAFRSATPLSFLTGVGQIQRDFEVTLDSAPPKSDLISLTLVPRRDGASVGRLRLLVAPDTFDIRGADVYDPQGNVSRLRFTHLRRNQGLDDAQFVFKVPPGVDVVDAPMTQ